MDEPSANAQLAAAVIEAAMRSGVTEWVVCSGARNLPLVEVLMVLPEDRRGKVWNFFEERSAAFFALGRVKAFASARVAVITTSGTAAAELLPATIEAHYSGHSLLLISADRPVEFRGSGAPQAIEQSQLLTPFVSRSVEWQTADDRPQVEDAPQLHRPEHWNVCFSEPEAGDRACVLSVEVEVGSGGDSVGAGRRKVARPESLVAFCGSDRLLVLLGELLQSEREIVEPALVELGVPIWAEASSGLRESLQLQPLILRGGEKDIARLNPTHVLRIGLVPSLRYWRDLEKLPEVDVLSLTRTGYSGLARDSRVICTVDGLAMLARREPNDASGQAGDCPSEPCDGRKSPASSQLDAMLSRFPASEPALFRRLSEQIESDALVFVGNSLPIREWNLAASYQLPHPHCHASRGANGIDGQVSTFLGLCAQPENSGSGAWGVFGDLTTLYDLSAPWVVPQLKQGVQRRIVVINNGGGRIFDRLPAVRAASEQQTSVIRNPHAHDFRHWAAMWGMGYARWTGDDQWVEPGGDTVVIEVRPDEQQTAEFWQQWETTSESQ